MAQGRIKKIALWALALFIVLYIAFRVIAPPMLEKSLNQRLDYSDRQPSAATLALQDSMTIMDWHSDSLLWNRNILEQADYGHADVPRLQAAGFDLVMLTAVTKSPSGQNIEENTGDSDNITALVIAQGWPVRTWSSLLERALYQAEKLDDAVSASNGELQWVRNQQELAALRAARGEQHSSRTIGALMGAEGAHPLEGDLANIDRMYAAGYRMMGITHFFDNELAGSLHGVSNAGLTPFGRAAINRFDELAIIIDLAHVSETAAREITTQSTRPQVVSHTGFKGYCNTERNFTDDLMKAIADKGGLIAVGFWEEAICTPTPAGIAGALIYGIELVGEDHVVIGSDWDGSTTSITASDFPLITEALLSKGVPEATIRKIMGENSLAFLERWLPAE